MAQPAGYSGPLGQPDPSGQPAPETQHVDEIQSIPPGPSGQTDPETEQVEDIQPVQPDPSSKPGPEIQSISQGPSGTPVKPPETVLPTTESTPWMHSMCFRPWTDFPTCLLGCFCPCVLYGKTQTRLQHIHAGEQTLDDKKFKPCNKFCWIHAVTGCIPNCSAICTFTQHSRIRGTFRIEGSTFKDLAKACCINQCTLMQADREVRARANIDEKARQDGIFVKPYDTNNEKMRYVPPDHLFGDRLNSRKLSRSVPEGSAGIDDPMSGGLQTTDGAMEMPEVDPNKTRQKLRSALGSALGRSPQPPPSRGIRAPTRNAENTAPQSGKAQTMNKGKGRENNTLREANDQVLRAPPQTGTGNQVKEDSDDTVVNKGHQDEGSDPTPLSGVTDETVFVYYNPNTPQPQRLRDCLKTNTSESTADLRASGSNRREQALSSSSASDSCAGDETLSFVEPSIRTTLNPVTTHPINSFSREQIASQLQSRPLSNITEEQQVERVPSNRSMKVNLSEPSQNLSEGSDEPITDAHGSSSAKGMPKTIRVRTDYNFSREMEDEEVLRRAGALPAQVASALSSAQHIDASPIPSQPSSQDVSSVMNDEVLRRAGALPTQVTSPLSSAQNIEISPVPSQPSGQGHHFSSVMTDDEVLRRAGALPRQVTSPLSSAQMETVSDQLETRGCGTIYETIYENNMDAQGMNPVPMEPSTAQARGYGTIYETTTDEQGMNPVPSQPSAGYTQVGVEVREVSDSDEEQGDEIMDRIAEEAVEEVLRMDREQNGQTQQHPRTRESIILPSTPLALDEVMEEIDLGDERKVPKNGKFGAMTLGSKFGRKMRPSFFDGNSEP